MNIHLLHNDKFDDQFIKRFNKFHSNNLYVKHSTRISKIEFDEKNTVAGNILKHELCLFLEDRVKETKEPVNIYIHYLNLSKALIVNKLKKKYPNINTYWIYYGSDLYNPLYRFGKYDLYDYPFYRRKTNIFNFFKQIKYLFKTKEKGVDFINRTISELDYFCFWNIHDYNLLKQNFSTNATYLPFIYNHINISPINSTVEKKNIIVNHSAAITGNHITMFNFISYQKLMNIFDKVIVPLNYGSEIVKKNVIHSGRKLFGDQFYPIIDFMPLKMYEELLNTVAIAFFGHKRQQAGFNIFYLISCGAKIYLKPENSILKFLNENGVKVFNIDDKISHLDISQPLAPEVIIKNRELISEIFSEKRVNHLYLNLVK